MTGFDSFAIVDWSGGNDTGPTPCKDAIWACVARAGKAEEPVYLRNRPLAESWLAELIEVERDAGRRLMIGFDFPFGYPQGFARAMTGRDDPLALWDWIEARIEDSPNGNNRFDLAGEINARLPGIGPFWFNGLRRDIPHLPRKGTDRRDMPFAEKRHVETLCKGAFPVWQLAGAGAVGGQVLTGLPVLSRLRQRFSSDIAVWPFQPLNTSVALVEIWPGLIARAVKRAEAQGGIRDAHQVRLLALALSRLNPDELDVMLAVDAPEEGWILGLGFEPRLEAAVGALTPPPLKDDCFALPPGFDWAPVDDALTLLRDRLHPVTHEETIPAGQALGRVLAAPAKARRANPPRPNTAVDGYGFAAAATGSGPQVLPLCSGRAAPGAPFRGKLKPGQAVRVLTGATLPDGVDTVILQEDVTLGDGAIAFHGPVKPGANTRRAGEDVADGTVIVDAGRRLAPSDLALLAATGVDELAVHKVLRVAVISTGDELADPGDRVTADRIFDANRPMLCAMAERFGYRSVDMGRVPDDRAALKSRLDEAAGRADVILTSGGASAGDEDHVSALLTEAGAMALWRIAIKPGRPLALGVWNGTPVFGLPGNPVAAFVCTLIFARPAMGLLAGEGWVEPQRFTVPAAFSKRRKPGRREYLRARLRDGQAEVFASEGSGRISGLSWADGLVELSEDGNDIEPGDPVIFMPYTGFGL